MNNSSTIKDGSRRRDSSCQVVYKGLRKKFEFIPSIETAASNVTAAEAALLTQWRDKRQDERSQYYFPKRQNNNVCTEERTRTKSEEEDFEAHLRSILRGSPPRGQAHNRPRLVVPPVHIRPHSETTMYEHQKRRENTLSLEEAFRERVSSSMEYFARKEAAEFEKLQREAEAARSMMSTRHRNKRKSMEPKAVADPEPQAGVVTAEEGHEEVCWSGEVPVTLTSLPPLAAVPAPTTRKPRTPFDVRFPVSSTVHAKRPSSSTPRNLVKDFLLSELQLSQQHNEERERAAALAKERTKAMIEETKAVIPPGVPSLRTIAATEATVRGKSKRGHSIGVAHELKGKKEFNYWEIVNALSRLKKGK